MKGPEPLSQAAAGAFPLRRFTATRISQAIAGEVRGCAEGRVEGVHRSATNIRWGGRMLTVAHASMGGLPNGILVEPPTPLDQIGIRLGMAVMSDGSALWIPGASVAILLGAAAPWSPTLAAFVGLRPEAGIYPAERALSLAAGHAPRLGLGPLLRGLVDREASVGSLGRAAAWSLAEVVTALASGNPDGAIEAAFPLIGLGPGATPSGDDLLVGFAAGLAATGHPHAASFASGVAARAVGLTTSIAESYLLHAGRLEFAERVHAVAHAILEGSEGELPGAVAAALAWGASSGADLLVGLLVGIEAAAPGLVERLRACADERHVAA